MPLGSARLQRRASSVNCRDMPAPATFRNVLACLAPFGRYSKTLMLHQLSSSFPRGAKRGAAHNGGARQALGSPLVQGSGGRDNSCELQSTAPTHPTQRLVAASCASTSTNTQVLHLLGMWPHALTKKPWIGKPTCNHVKLLTGTSTVKTAPWQQHGVLPWAHVYSGHAV